MNKQEIKKRLNAIFCDIFDDDNIVLEDNTTADDIEDWDSLEQINILTSAEKEFGIRFSVGEIENLPDVGAMIDLIYSKL